MKLTSEENTKKLKLALSKIANAYIELSQDKVFDQRNEFIRIARAALKQSEQT